ncbi:MAG: DUF86 domain-containing protein [Verrucomicrobia bacterium]|jgi:uncharacterized protein with HEPN domain|nr:DUF86 domain-containing protein [Verrucomicrobiota bacterium]
MWTDAGTAVDILAAARHIREFAAGFDRTQFDADLRTQSAVLHQIIVLGEAVKRLSDEFRQAHPLIPWAQIAGMRDRCVHGYDNVDLDLVWEVVSTHAPQLAEYLQKVVPQPPPTV